MVTLRTVMYNYFTICAQVSNFLHCFKGELHLNWNWACFVYCLTIFNTPCPLKTTQQNSYSISHLLGTVTTQWLPLWWCSHCSLVPDTVTTEQWLHRTHTLFRYPLLWDLCRSLSTRHLVGNWQSLHGKILDTCYTQSLCRNQGGTDTRFCSLPLGF